MTSAESFGMLARALKRIKKDTAKTITRNWWRQMNLEKLSILTQRSRKLRRTFTDARLRMTRFIQKIFSNQSDALFAPIFNETTK